MLKALASVVIFAAALTATLMAQIPEQAKWEITFAQVEASAGLPDLRTAASQTFEARLMQRPWSAVAPLPFLRLLRTGRKMQAQLFVYWATRYIAPGSRPEGPDIVCRDGIV